MFVLSCEFGHQWVAPLKSKQVKKWCMQCKVTEKERIKLYYRNLDQIHMQELNNEQDELMRQAEARMGGEDVEAAFSKEAEKPFLAF